MTNYKYQVWLSLEDEDEDEWTDDGSPANRFNAAEALLEGPVFILGSEVVPDDVDRVLELVRHFALFRVCSLPGCRRGFVGKRKLDFCQGCEMRASEADLAVHECSICCCDMHAISAHVLPCCKHRIHRSCADKCEACPYCRKRTHV